MDAQTELLLQWDRVARSQIIYEATAVEGLVEKIIATHFCPDVTKHLVFIAFMFVSAEVAFSKKTEILAKLLKNHYPDILQDTPDLINNIDSLRRLRNKLAHNEPVVDDVDIESGNEGIWLRFLNRKGDIIKEFISKEDIIHRTRTTHRLRWYLQYVQLEIENRVAGKEHNKRKVILETMKAGLLDKD